MKSQEGSVDSQESIYRITVIGFNLDKNNKNLITRLVKAVFATEPQIVDLMSNYFTPSKEDLVIVMGLQAEKILKENKIFSNQINLPEPDLLTEEEENESARESAWKNLVRAKESIDKNRKNNYGRVLTKESLPSFTANEVLAIEKLNPNGWIGRTQDGKTIRLSSGKIQGASEDITMTYAELYALKIAVELLGIQEFELVPNNETHPSGNN